MAGCDRAGDYTLTCQEEWENDRPVYLNAGFRLFQETRWVLETREAVPSKVAFISGESLSNVAFVSGQPVLRGCGLLRGTQLKPPGGSALSCEAQNTG